MIKTILTAIAPDEQPSPTKYKTAVQHVFYDSYYFTLNKSTIAILAYQCDLCMI